MNLKKLKLELIKMKLFQQILKIIKSNYAKIIENFELIELIGSGCESMVYKAIYKKTKNPFAFKMIVNEKSKVNKKKVKKDELTISSQLRHINIIDYYGFVEINDKVCIIMEYTPFGNLRMFTKKIMKTDYLSESILCYLTYQILNGLKYCHKSKIAHLDIKPENIVVFNCLNIKIIDFSMSLDYSKIKSNKIILPVQGTRFYIAPEILSQMLINVKDLNKIDLYSLGVTLYNLAFGYYPFGLTYDDDYKKIYVIKF